MNDKIHDKISSAAAICAGTGMYIYGGKVIQSCAGKIAKMPHPALSEQEVWDLRDASKRMLQGEGFDESKLVLIDTSSKAGTDFISNTYKRKAQRYERQISCHKNGFAKKILKKMSERRLLFTRSKLNAYKNGKNACYIRNLSVPYIGENSAILVNMEKSPQFFAHELGHATNHRFLGRNTSKMIYEIMRIPSKHNKLLFGIFAVSMFMNKKNPEETKNDNFIKKTAQFIKNNGTKLSLLTCVPLLIEEGLANIHGQRFAKKYMDPKYMKLMTSTHMHSFVSYSKYAAGIGLIMYLSNKTRDFVYKLLKNLNKDSV